MLMIVTRIRIGYSILCFAFGLIFQFYLLIFLVDYVVCVGGCSQQAMALSVVISGVYDLWFMNENVWRKEAELYWSKEEEFSRSF